MLFEGELNGRCIPEQTRWHIKSAVKGDPTGRGHAYNPALQIELLKHPEDGGRRWGEVFKVRKHALDLVTDRQKAESAKAAAYRSCTERLNARCNELLNSATMPAADPAQAARRGQDAGLGGPLNAAAEARLHE